MERTCENICFHVPPWPAYMNSNYRFFEYDEHYATRHFDVLTLIFMFKGTLDFIENGVPVSLKSGEWYFQMPGRHVGHVGNPAPEYYYIHFSGRFTCLEEPPGVYNKRVGTDTEFYNAPRIIIPKRATADIDMFKTYFNELDFMSAGRNDTLAAQGIFLSLLDKMVWMVAERESGVSLLAQRVERYLQDFFYRRVSNEELSAMFNYTPDYITKVFKQAYGVAPNRYGQNIRMRHATDMLINTNYSISRIAKNVGYGIPSVFYKTFIRHFGVSPTAWRNMHKNSQEERL